MTMAKAGRKLRLTPQLVEDLCAQISRGVTFKDAAAICDISYSSFHKWKRKAKYAKTGIFAEFGLRLNKAEAEATAVLFDIINEAASRGREVMTEVKHYDANDNPTGRTVTRQKIPRDANLALKILERRHPDRYGLRRHFEHSGHIGGGGMNVPVQLVFDDGEGAKKDGGANPPTAEHAAGDDDGHVAE